MSIRIISDGSTNGTRVFTEQGEEILGINYLTITADPKDGIVRAVMLFDQVTLDLENVNPDEYAWVDNP